MAHPQEKIEKIEEIGETRASNPAMEQAEPEVRVAPNKELFDSLLAKPQEVEPASGRKIDTNSSSLIDEVSQMGRRVDQVQTSPQLLVAQSQEVITKIEELKEKLSTPNLEIKDSTKSALRNKLLHIDENLRIALDKAGIEYTPPVASATPQTPIERFLGLLTNGQKNMDSLAQNVQAIHANGKEISLGTMLLLQTKVNAVQQQLEFFTNVLNKALESTKTIMNVQV